MRNTEQTIGLASSSMRRKVALEQIPDLKVVNVGGGEEAPMDDLLTIALSKIAFAYPTILESCRSMSTNLIGVLAADTNTLIRVFASSGTQLERKNKPHKPETTLNHFRRMSKAAEQSGAGYYEVAAASALQTDNSSLAGVETTRVTLNQEKLNQLALEDGFAQYQENFANFYKSEAYHNSGCQALEITDISAGISLPVLIKMGVVEQVNEVKLKELRSRVLENTLKKALLNVAVGFSPQVLERIHPDAMACLMGWSWTNEVVDFILQ